VARENDGITVREIRTSLGRMLPAYMLPARWMSFAQLPRNANGKIDRRNIRDLFVSEVSDSSPIKEDAASASTSAGKSTEQPAHELKSSQPAIR